MTFDQHLKVFVDRLTEVGIENPLRELRLMVACVIGTSYEDLLFSPPQTLTQDQFCAVDHFVRRRCQREPLAKILGKKEFWGRDFRVTKDTLDPRPDSEVLIDVALKILPVHGHGRILDLGTGSGCLLISLLCERLNFTGVGVDLSLAALDIARHNALTLGCGDRVTWTQSDWFSSVEGDFDLIIANPPYIARDEILSAETLYDPESSLFADDEGLSDYRKIFASVAPFMSIGAVLIFEIGSSQVRDVQTIANEHEFRCLGVYKDLAQHDRCLVFSK